MRLRGRSLASARGCALASSVISEAELSLDFRLQQNAEPSQGFTILLQRFPLASKTQKVTTSPGSWSIKAVQALYGYRAVDERLRNMVRMVVVAKSAASVRRVRDYAC